MNKVTMKGNALTLIGELPKVGSKIIPFTLLANNLTPKTENDYAGKVLIIATVPSLDTGVCDMEIKRFNKEATNLSADVQILAVSTDLPFAQARWCGAAGVSAVETLSDHYSADFGKNYGILIKELRLLARSIFVFNKKSELVYCELVEEVTQEPNYDKALEAAKKAL